MTATIALATRGITLPTGQADHFSDEVELPGSGSLPVGTEYCEPLREIVTPPEAQELEATQGPCWDELYPPLQSLAHYLVNTLPLPYWQGREADIADDIVQETMRRLLERIQKGQRGTAPPVKLARQMMTTIAFNYYRDLKRHERRLLRLDKYVYTSNPPGESEGMLPILGGLIEQADLEDVVEKADQEALFNHMAEAIRRFPKKQQRALLTDLANLMCFEDQPTALQAAFLRAGIELRNYRRSLPDNQRERSRHISLLSQAYKRVRLLPRTWEEVAKGAV
jgi:DNA-directed RNA polymerase specialized sigma24 family protein